jgi:predicted phosphodiesterase
MIAGTVSVGSNLIVGNMGSGTMNMTGGSITVTGTFGIAQSGGAGDVFLDGGTVSSGSFSMLSGAAMDITGGTLIVSGDVTSTINQYISSGWLTAYRGSGTLNVDYNVTNPGKTTVTGESGTPPPLPGQATNPSPSNGATGISTLADLSWTAGIYAVSHDVYFGTDFSDVNSAARLPGDLDGSGTVDYNDLFILTDYWVADPFGSEPYAGINDDNIVDFFDYALLAQDFSDSVSAAFKGNQILASYDPGPLALSTTYYWRIDEVNASGTTTGTVWSFTTTAAPPPLPGQATNPSPANGATGISTLADLSWTAGSDATSHDVYFGTDSTPDSSEFQGNRTATTFDPSTMANSTTYYWRIDEKNETGTTTGVVWSFTTAAFVEVHPYLTWRNDPNNSIAVNWWNPDATGDSTVDYGLTSSYGSTAYVATVSNFHHVELTGLTPGTIYHYRISSSDGTVGNDETFTTSTGYPTSLKFAVFGDTQSNYDEHRAQCDHMVQKNPDFVLHTGDLVEYGDSETDWKDFFKAEQNLVKSRVFMPTMGNHEVQPGGQPYYYYFDLYADGLAVPTNGMAGYGPRTYSFDYGNSHHIIISSYQINVTLERDWIAADLAAAAANPDIEWIFAYMHKPLYTAGQWPADKAVLALWGPVFDQYGVDIVFAGHNHIYERSYPINNDQIVSPGEGTIYMTCGIGARPGGSWNPGSPDAPFFEAWATPNKTGATYVTINGNSLSAELIMVDNVVLDTFTINH